MLEEAFIIIVSVETGQLRKEALIINVSPLKQDNRVKKLAEMTEEGDEALPPLTFQMTKEAQAKEMQELVNQIKERQAKVSGVSICFCHRQFVRHSHIMLPLFLLFFSSLS